MPATLLGTVGSWGIASDETGLIIEKIRERSRNEKNFIKSKVGDRVGRADYDESLEIEIEGKLTAASPWAQKLSAVLTMTNVVSSGHLQSVLAGKTYVDEVEKTRANEDWANLSFKAELLPFFP